ncbi:MAG: T9SS type A sorting domain-containing protein [Ginsengibacter sp.]
MKKKYSLFFIILFVLSFEKGFSQADSCIVLGCAANYGSQTTNNSLPDLPGGFPGSCYNPYVYRQIFWQFFYSPSGGDFTQTYTPTNGSPALDIDWVIYDIGTSPLSSISCPIDHSSWTQVACNTSGDNGFLAGPGTSDGTFTTTALHYYAIGIIIDPGVADPSPDANFTFDIGNPQIGGSDLTSANCPGVLPVQLSSFEASVSNCNVHLNWTVSGETNFKNYEVQYSTNGTSFNSIGIVSKTFQNTNSVQSYSYQHNNPEQGKIYYRLKMQDVDGKFEYSKIIGLNLDCNQSSIFVYPNPVTNILNVNISNSQNSQNTAKLFDSYGKLIYSGKLVSGTNSIDMSTFAKGIYWLTLKSNSETQNIKIIK